MGRRGLSAVGVAAAAMMHSPADSFLGSNGACQPLVHRNNGSAHGTRSKINDGSHAASSLILNRRRSLPLSRAGGAGGRAGLRRPAAWRLPSVRGGGAAAGGGAEDNSAALRRGDPSGGGVER